MYMSVILEALEGSFLTRNLEDFEVKIKPT
jgi:hypothetical protein